MIRALGRRLTASVVLVACIAAGARAELQIIGVNERIEAVVRAFVSIDDLACKAPRWWLHRALERAPDEARTALETLGYYQTTVAAEIGWTDACWRASLTIERGEQARLGDVRIGVVGPLADEPPLRALLAEPALRTGQQFTHERYESAKARMLELAEDLGYLDARFERSRVRVDPERNVADVELALDGGARYRVGTVTVDQDELRPELFGRFLRIRSGQPFDAHDLAATYRDLLGSQYFDQVMVTPEVELREDGLVPVRVTAVASEQRAILLGGGYATDTGPRMRADARYRRLNDRGHQADFSALVSGIQGELKGNYRLPFGDPASERLFAETAINYGDTGTYISRNWMIGGGRTRQRPNHWTETRYANFQLDEFDVGDQDGRSRLLLFGSNWTRKTLIETPRPLSGYALTLDLRGAASALLSDSDVFQAIARARHVFPLGERLRVLSRAASGWTWQSRFDALPPSLRFFAGGDNSVRGYDYESLGPEQDAEVVGGRRLLTGSVELDVLLRDRWSVALFADAGSAYDDSPDFSRSVGVGLRWYSPLGPLRFDLAHPLDDPSRSVRIHISLGPDL